MGYLGNFAEIKRFSVYCEHPDLMRRFLLIGLFILIPIGLATKIYTGPGSWWVYAHAGGVIYEIFWVFLALAIWPHRSEITVSMWVFLVTCFLETLQLWHPPFLQAIRGTFLGATLIGTTFVWSDFLYYVLGSLIGWAWIRSLRRLCPQSVSRL